jgi:hypothetical protein
MHYLDVSEQDGVDVDAGCADTVQWLVAQEFEVVGHLILLSEQFRAQAAQFEQDDEAWFLEHALRPSTVLVSDDQHILADISPWWSGEAAVRLFTTLADGSLVETVRVLSRGPVHKVLGRAFDQTGDHHPRGGRILRAFPLDALLGEHRRAVADQVAAAQRHTFEDYPRIIQQRMRHSLAVIESGGLLLSRVLGAHLLGALLLISAVGTFYGFVWMLVASMGVAATFSLRRTATLLRVLGRLEAPSFAGVPPRVRWVTGLLLAGQVVFGGGALAVVWLGGSALLIGPLLVACALFAWFAPRLHAFGQGDVATGFLQGDGPSLLAALQRGEWQALREQVAQHPDQRNLYLRHLSVEVPRSGLAEYAEVSPDGLLALAWHDLVLGNAARTELPNRAKTFRERSVEQFREAARQHPLDVEPWIGLVVSQATTDGRAAREAYKTGLACAPTNADLHRAMLSVHVAERDLLGLWTFARSVDCPALLAAAHVAFRLQGGSVHARAEADLVPAWEAFDAADLQGLNDFAAALTFLGHPAATLAQRALGHRTVAEPWCRMDENTKAHFPLLRV